MLIIMNRRTHINMVNPMYRTFLYYSKDFSLITLLLYSNPTVLMAFRSNENSKNRRTECSLRNRNVFLLIEKTMTIVELNKL